MGSQRALQLKQQAVEGLRKIFESRGVYLVDYRGLKVSEMQTLRRRIKPLQGRMKVVQNRLAIKYFEREKIAIGREVFQGPVAVVYGEDKFVELAKELVDFEKESKKIKIRSGIIEKRLVGSAEIAQVAKLPGKDQLLAMLLGAVASPLRKFGSALSAPLSHLLIALKQFKDKKEKGG